jgi:hypothetical protein
MTGDEFETVKAFSETLAILTDEQLLFVSKLVTREANTRAEKIRNPRVKLRLVKNTMENNNNDEPTE